MERERERKRDRDRETYIQTDRQTDRQTEWQQASNGKGRPVLFHFAVNISF